ncbi:twin-arginine translocation signal domain-containing protein [Halomicroarcula sp. F13]|uniref:Twin-arginine translocation signal domain-containing protein n=1 Tax=Haloarcula rubra TaxID=2487747 RepID=A0AAW4PMC5_9EURY|nr:glycosyl hydrolase family 18 protein [Halomicroarcula rubra]MBX0321864.1 twin-arginine translocation signal domain-containing protein [Halomicroarcula rubra]
MKPTLSRRNFLGALGATAAVGLAGGARGARSGSIHAALGAKNTPPPGTSVVGIYPAWSRYERDYMPGEVPLDQITHLQYAYLSVEEDGSVGYADQFADTRNLAAFQARKKNHPDTKMILSIGGFFASRYYSRVTVDSARRARFARTAVEIMREYDFDGLDLDWRYPSGEDADQYTRDGDIRQFTLLIQEVRRQLDAAGEEDDKDYELSLSAAINPNFAEELVVAELADAVDRVNVVCYDFAGPWDEYTGFGAPLYNPYPDSVPDFQYYTANAMDAWKARPIDPAKLNLTFATFGRGYTGVDPANRGFDQPFEGVPDGTFPAEEQGTYDFWDIEYNVNADNDYEYYWHDDAAAPYLYSENDREFVSYDNMRSVALKAEYVLDNDFGGMTMWDFHGDKYGALLYTVNEALAQ